MKINIDHYGFSVRGGDFDRNLLDVTMHCAQRETSIAARAWQAHVAEPTEEDRPPYIALGLEVEESSWSVLADADPQKVVVLTTFLSLDQAQDIIDALTAALVKEDWSPSYAEVMEDEAGPKE